ncbi:transcriptional regulator [Putridiphycobacter roseus]|uniref:Transcriptional regulator n=1 Tax=Putridiphycobacter roseus TaxID=2219161 RepID=A0A2W1NPG1_9FLAO|nr:MerR family transcriptional regulator [Putridiphycobacter roseus]PZE16508.1 transcriptional regulator [Putridiphycobacter roseus]
MQIANIELTKLYYSIGEVADMFDVNASLIRFWEKEFSVIKPKKNKKGNRMFTPNDIRNFEKIYQLVKHKGFTLDGAKKELSKKNEKLPLNLEVMERLEKLKLKLLALKVDVE